MDNPNVPSARLGHRRVVTRRQALSAATAVIAGVMASGLVPSRAPALAQNKRASVKIINKSDWEIHHFYLSSSQEDEWGPDQLGETVVGTGDEFTLNNIPCDTYDVKLVDEDGDACVVEDVDICGAAEGWIITNKILLGCEENTAQAASRTRCPTA